MLIKPTEKAECKQFDMSVIPVLRRRPRKKNHILEVAFLGGRAKSQWKSLDVSDIELYQATLSSGWVRITEWGIITGEVLRQSKAR